MTSQELSCCSLGDARRVEGRQKLGPQVGAVSRSALERG